MPTPRALTDDRLDEFCALLSRHTSVQDAIAEAARAWDMPTLDGCNVRRRFRVRFGDSPSAYLAKPQTVPAQVPVARAEQPGTPCNSASGSRLVQLTREEPRTIEQLSDELGMLPRDVRRLVAEAQGTGYEVRFADDGKLHPGAAVEEHAPIAVPAKRDGSTIRFAVMSDTHFGSRQCMRDEIADFVRRVADEGVQTILHAGDLLDGVHVYRGQEYDLAQAGFEAQAAVALQGLPQLVGLHYYWIDGNHDDCYWKQTGLPTGKLIERMAQASGRADLHYLGRSARQVTLADLLVELQHPDKAGAYAKSYSLQKIVEGMESGTKPHVLITGHEHDFVWSDIRNVAAIKACTFQLQTDYMRRKGLEPALGGLIIEATTDGHGSLLDIDVRRVRYYAHRHRPVEVTRQ